MSLRWLLCFNMSVICVLAYLCQVRRARTHFRCFLIPRQPRPLVRTFPKLQWFALTLSNLLLVRVLVHKSSKQDEDLDRFGNVEIGYTLRHLEAMYIEVGLDSHYASW